MGAHRFIVVALLTLGLSSCAFFRKARTPMHFSLHPSAAETDASHLVLFLPGLLDEPEDVVRGGMLEELRGAPAFDAVIADAHFGYYEDMFVLDRLHTDVVGPLRDKYDEFWIVGISMGGYGATAYAERYPEEVTGVMLIAPYLGQDKVVRSVEDAGGLHAWGPHLIESKSSRTAHGVAMWNWFKDRPAHPDVPIVHLASGEADGRMRELELLRAVLPKQRVHTAPGGHDWPVWRSLFAKLVKSELAQRSMQVAPKVSPEPLAPPFKKPTLQPRQQPKRVAEVPPEPARPPGEEPRPVAPPTPPKEKEDCPAMACRYEPCPPGVKPPEGCMAVCGCLGMNNDGPAVAPAPR